MFISLNLCSLFEYTSFILAINFEKNSLFSSFFSVQTDSIIGIRDNTLDIKKTAPLPVITLTNSDGKRASDSLVIDSVPDPDGMMNLISNDLDYLLNRTQEVPIATAQAVAATSSNNDTHHHQQLPIITPPPPVAFANTTSSITSQSKLPTTVLLQHDVIIEESEHEVDS